MPERQLEGMTVEMWPVHRIQRYANNPRDNDKAVDKVAASLREFGWQQPIVVDAEGVIIVGDTRFLAATTKLAQTEVPVHVARTLSPAKVKAYRIADNRVGEEATWNEGRLAIELRELEALDMPLRSTGLDDSEMERILGTGEAVEVSRMSDLPLPTMSWVLIGLPTVRFPEIAELVEQAQRLPGAICEVVANDDTDAIARFEAAARDEREPTDEVSPGGRHDEGADEGHARTASRVRRGAVPPLNTADEGLAPLDMGRL